MTQIAQGAHAYLTMAPGQVYRVQADDVATVQVLYGAPSAVVTLTAESRSFGPYDSDARIKVTANTAAAEYTLLRAHYAELTQAQIEGGAVGALASNNAGGVIEPDGDVPTLGGAVTLPAMQSAFDTGTTPQKAAFQASVSGANAGPYMSGVMCSDIGMPAAPGITKGGKTWQQTIFLPAGVDSVSVAVLSDAADVSTYTGIKVYVQTTTQASLVNPVDGAMVQATFGGSANPAFVPGTIADPVPIWSDVVPVINRGSGPCWLIMRVWYPATVAAGGGAFTATAGGVTRVAKMQALGGAAYYGFATTDTAANSAAAMTAVTTMTPMLVSANFRRPVPVVWQFGDSTRQGWYGEGAISSVERWALARTLSGKPVSAVNMGYSGQTGIQYLARLKRLADSGRKCDLLIWEIASPNDGILSLAVLSAQVTRAAEAISIAQKIGARVVLDGPYPMTAAATTAVVRAIAENAEAYGQEVASYGKAVYSGYRGLHDPLDFGRWRPGYNNAADGLHQNELATAEVILPALTTALASYGY